MSLIRIEHLRKEFPNSTPLKDVCAEINEGEIISVIGPSGTGKSTLLRCLNRLEHPTSGRIVVDRQEISNRIFYMDEGVIYEEGTPEQIFEKPQREKTRRFIKGLKEMAFTLDSPEIDYNGMMDKIRQFGREAMLSKQQVNSLMLCVEELAVQSISTYPIRVHAEHSEDDDAVVLEIQWGGEPFDPLTDGDQMSVSIVRHLTSNLQYNYERENRIRAEIRV